MAGCLSRQYRVVRSMVPDFGPMIYILDSFGSGRRSAAGTNDSKCTLLGPGLQFCPVVWDTNPVDLDTPNFRDPYILGSSFEFP